MRNTIVKYWHWQQNLILAVRVNCAARIESSSTPQLWQEHGGGKTIVKQSIVPCQKVSRSSAPLINFGNGMVINCSWQTNTLAHGHCTKPKQSIKSKIRMMVSRKSSFSFKSNSIPPIWTCQSKHQPFWHFSPDKKKKKKNHVGVDHIYHKQCQSSTNSHAMCVEYNYTIVLLQASS